MEKSITQLLENILSAVYGEDVRKSIHDSIQKCYEDATTKGNANMEVSQARGFYNSLSERLAADLSNTIERIDEGDSKLRTLIDSVVSGSPLVASSIGEMTDTTRVYVNTTDGHWYYYNGTNWQDGGVYQATSNQNDVDYLISEVGKKYDTFTTVSTNPNSKNTYIQGEFKVGDKIKFGLNTINENLTVYAVIGFRADNTYRTLFQNRQPNTEYEYILEDDFVKLQFYINCKQAIPDEDIYEYVNIWGTLKKQVYENKADIETNAQNITDNTKEIEKLPYGNLINFTSETVFESGSINKANGQVVGVNYHTDYIPVKPNTKYYQMGGTLAGNYACYDKNKNFVEGLEITVTEGLNQWYNKGYFTTPDNAYYYRFTLTDGHMPHLEDFYLSETAQEKLPMGFDFSDLVPRIKAQLSSMNIDNLFNSKILVMGDSISTDAYGSYKKWVTDLIEDGTFKAENVTNNSQHATGFVANYNQGNNTFLERLQAVENKDTFDMVVTFGGINDYIQNIDFDTFKTAVDTYLEYLVQNFTQARLVVLSPLRISATWQNQVGKYVTDYTDYIKEKAKYYSLPVLNLTDESGFCPYIQTFRNMWTLLPQGYDSHDGVHPNEKYQRKYLAPIIKNFLKELIG